MKVHIKLRCFIKFFHEEKFEIVEINQRLLKVYGGQTLELSIVEMWEMYFRSVESDLNVKIHFSDDSANSYVK